MSYEFNGKTIATNDNGYLEDHHDWSEELAQHIADVEEVGELTERHWDIIHFLRDEYFNNNGNQPNERQIIKAMSDKWGRKTSSKEMYELFPHMPSKQGGKVAGLPESRRKGGY